MTIDEVIREFDGESRTTRRLLERVPTDKLEWAPHSKSMTLGRLAMHLAGGPGAISGWSVPDRFEFTRDTTPPPASTAEILAAHDRGAEQTKANLEAIGDAGLGTTWTATVGGKTLMTMPKAALIRSLVLNHAYHHRGQLSVYLRLLDVAVPSIYGPSADENPFA